MRSDRERWERRYIAEESAHDRADSFAPDDLLQQYAGMFGSGIALDLAAGHGGNALLAASRGYRVHAVDISFTALSALKREAERRGADVACIAADLDSFVLPVNYYDLVMVFYFFSPALMNAIAGCLKRSGLLFYATFNHRHTSLKPTFNPAFLVPPGGLGRYFPEFEIALDEPGGGAHENIARLIAAKPAGDFR